MKRLAWQISDRRAERFLFLEEFEYDEVPGRKAFQLFDINNATLYVFVCRGDCRKEELLDDRICLRLREPGFINSCQLIAGRMGEAAPILYGRNAFGVFQFLLRHSILADE